MQGEVDAGFADHPLHTRARLDQRARMSGTGKDIITERQFTATGKQFPQMIRKRQCQRLAVFGLRDDQGHRDQIYVLPADPGALAAAQASEQQYREVIGQCFGLSRARVGAQARHRIEPRRQLIDLDHRLAACGAVPRTGAAESVDGVVEDNRCTGLIVVLCDGEIQNRAQGAHGQIGISLAVLAARHHILADFGDRLIQPVRERHVEHALIVVKCFGRKVAARHAEFLEHFMQGDGPHARGLFFDDGIAAIGNLPEFLLRFEPCLLDGLVGIAADRETAGFAVDTFFDDEGLGATFRDAQSKAFELRIADEDLRGRRGGEGVHMTLGEAPRDPLIIRKCRRHVDTPLQVSDESLMRRPRGSQRSTL